jgi:hypothetical protein
VASELVTSVFTLAGVALGSAGTIVVQYLATRESRRAAKAAARDALRSEREKAMMAFLDSCQRAEAAAEARAYGKDQPADPDALKQDLWYQQKCLQLIAGEHVRSASYDYANQLTTALFNAAPTGKAITDFIAKKSWPFFKAAQAELGIPDEPGLR